MKKIFLFISLFTCLISKAQETRTNPTKIYNVVFYGADNTGVADATAAIQRAYTAADATGGIVYYPRGTYKVTATIKDSVSNVVTEGQGEGTQGLATGDYGDIFQFGPTVTPVAHAAYTGLQVKNIFINTTVVRTSGAALNIPNSHGTTIVDVRIGTIDFSGTSTVFPYDGIKLKNQSMSVIANTQVAAIHYGVYYSGTKIVAADAFGTNYWDGVITGNSNICGKRNTAAFVTGSIGVYIAGGTGGILIGNSNVSFWENGLKIDNSSGLANREVFLQTVFWDDNGGSAIYVKDTLNILQVTGGWIAGAGRGAQTPGPGLYVDSTTVCVTGYFPSGRPRIIWTGGTCYANDRGGMYIGTGDVSVTGVHFSKNLLNDINFGVNTKSANIAGNVGAALTPILVHNTSTIAPTSLLITKTADDGVTGAFFNNTNAANNSVLTYYPQSGTNVSSGFSFIPKGTGTAGINIFNTDFIADATNYEYLQLASIGSTGYRINSTIGGTGVSRPINIFAAPNINQLYLDPSSRVYINSATNHSSEQFQVTGTSWFSGTIEGGARLLLPGSTTVSSIKAGTINLQSYALNNMWMSDNLTYNGSNFIATAQGYTSMLYMQSPETQFKTSQPFAASATVTQHIPLKINEFGKTVAIGGDISGTVGTYTGATLVADSASARLSRRLEPAQGVSVTAANSLTLGADGNLFPISGNTQINAITTSGWQSGSEIGFIFSGTPTVKNNTAGAGGTATLLLAGGQDFAAAAGDYLGLIYDGTNWHEKNRKVAGSGGAGVYTFSNGITESPAGTVKLGGTLSGNTTIDGSTSNELTIQGSTSTANGLLYVNNTLASGNNSAIKAASIDGSAITAVSSTNAAVSGTSTSSMGGSFASTSGTSISGISTSSLAMGLTVLPSSTSTLVPVMKLTRSSSGTAANGIGGSIDFYEKNTTGTIVSNQIGSILSDATGATVTSSLVFRGITSAGAMTDWMTIGASGEITQTGALRGAYRAITALRTLDATDYMVNCTANSFTVTLPTAVGITGRMYIIKNTGGATTITIATTSSQTIDGSAPTTITTLVPMRVMSDGANWITW